MDIFDLLPKSRIGTEASDSDSSSEEEERRTASDMMVIRRRLSMASMQALPEPEPEPEPEPADVEGATRARLRKLPGIPIYVSRPAPSLRSAPLSLTRRCWRWRSLQVGKESFDMVEQRPVKVEEILATIKIFREQLPGASSLERAGSGLLAVREEEEEEGDEQEQEEPVTRPPQAPPDVDIARQRVPCTLLTRAWLFQRGVSTALEKMARLLEPRNSHEHAVSPASLGALVRRVRASVQRVRTAPTDVMQSHLQHSAGALDVLLDEAADIVDELEVHSLDSSPREFRSRALGSEDAAAIQWLLDQLDAVVSARPVQHFEVQPRPVTAGSPARNRSSSGDADRVPTPRFKPPAVGWTKLEASQTGAGADMLAVDDPGALVFDAIEADDLTQLRFLLDIGVLPNVRSSEGETALMAAAARDRSRCLTCLLRAGADASAADQSGDTAFHYACSFGSVSCVKELARRAGFDQIGRRNAAGQTGRELALGSELHQVAAAIDALPMQEAWWKSLHPSAWSHDHVVAWFEETFRWQAVHAAALRKAAFVDGQMLTRGDPAGLAALFDMLGISDDDQQRQFTDALQAKDTIGWE